MLRPCRSSQGHGTARPHCVNQMERAHSKPLAGTAWQGKGMGVAWERHAMCESALMLLVQQNVIFRIVPVVPANNFVFLEIKSYTMVEHYRRFVE